MLRLWLSLDVPSAFRPRAGLCPGPIPRQSGVKGPIPGICYLHCTASGAQSGGRRRASPPPRPITTPWPSGPHCPEHTRNKGPSPHWIDHRTRATRHLVWSLAEAASVGPGVWPTPSKASLASWRGSCPCLWAQDAGLRAGPCCTPGGSSRLGIFILAALLDLLSKRTRTWT